MLTAHEACALHEAFVEDSLEILTSLGVRVELHLDEASTKWHADRLQPAGDLGERMLDALANGLARGYGPVAIVGSDAPDLPPAYLRQLLTFRADVTLGPAEDSGYYAIVCRQTHPDMFRGVRWSTEHAFHDTLRACEACGLSTACGRLWHDVDEPQDLERLVNPGPRTTAWLRARDFAK